MRRKGRSVFSALLFAISIVALSQFALYYLRAILVVTAEQPLSDQLLALASLQQSTLSGHDFKAITSLHDLTLGLDRNRPGLGFVSLYYRITESIGSLAGRHLPSLAGWSAREMTLCTRYAAVQVDRSLQANLALAASIRS